MEAYGGLPHEVSASVTAGDPLVEEGPENWLLLCWPTSIPI